MPDCKKNKIAEYFVKFFKDNPKFLILDTETTGLDNNAEIVEISVINEKGETVIDTLVKPVNPIPKGASKVHNIFDNDVKNSPTWDKIWPQVQEKLQGQRVAIYNAAYDIRMIKQCCKLYGIPDNVGAKGFCVMEKFGEWNGDWNDYHQSYRWVKLEKAAKLMKVDLNDIVLHRALGDCQLTLRVMKSLANQKTMF